MNAVLGGLFSSRINLNLREVHGYTYGAFSGFDWRRGSGSVRRVDGGEERRHGRGGARDSAARSIASAPTPISEDELSLATSYLDGVFPIRYETTAAIAAALAQPGDPWTAGGLLRRVSRAACAA